MHIRPTTALLVMTVTLVAGALADARITRDWPYKDLFEQADLVVMAEATAITPTKDQLNEKFWDGEGWFGQNGQFAIKHILKGKEEAKKIDVLHFRTDNQYPNGPQLAKFRLKNEYLLFLKSRTDGRYEPLSGQIDPVLSMRWISTPTYVTLDP